MALSTSVCNSGLTTSPRPRPAHSATRGSRTSSPARSRLLPGPRRLPANTHPVGRRPCFSRLQRRENEPGGGDTARGHRGDWERGRPRHHVKRPCPAAAQARTEPAAGRSTPELCVASRPGEEEEEEEAAPPSPRRAP